MITVNIWYPINTALESPMTLVADALTDLSYPDFDYHGQPFDHRILPDFIDVIRPGDMMRWGHAGIQFSGVVSESGAAYPDAYRAFWPGLGEDWREGSPGRIVTDREYDIHEEGTDPSRTIVLVAGYNEALIYRYWDSLIRQPLDYRNTGYNCCGAVAASIRDGFPVGSQRDAPAYPPISCAGGYLPIGYSNPYALEDWVTIVNQWMGLRAMAPISPPDVILHGHHDRS